MSSAPLHLRHDPHWVARRFDRIAWFYPLFEKLFLVPDRTRDRAVHLLELASGQRVLDVGVGRGPRSAMMSKLVGPTGHVVGLDLSDGMLEHARREVIEHGSRNVELLHMNVLDHHATEPYDSVLFSFSLTCLGDPSAVLDHVWGYLKPGGRLVVLDGQLPPRTRWLSTPLLPAIRWFLESTVLGDPDMRPLKELEAFALPIHVEWSRSNTYFVAQLVKSA